MTTDPVPEIAAVRVVDGLLDAISARLAAKPPERGGAILATGGLLHLLVADSDGRCTGTSWNLSRQLSRTVRELEAAGYGTLAGTVHTHPAACPDPSTSDIATTRTALERNAHLDGLLIAIVTAGEPRRHDLRVNGQHRMSLHLLRRTPAGGDVLCRVRGESVPLAADLAAAGIPLTTGLSTRSWRRTRQARKSRILPALPTAVRLNHGARLAVRVPSARPAALFIHPEYPVTGPVAVAAVAAQQGGDQPVELRLLPSPWDPHAASGPQLGALARAAAGRRTPRAVARVWPIVGALSSRKVLVAGAGSVGSRIAEDLVRAGVSSLVVIDPDQVQAPNLARSVYVAADVGVPKPSALARRLRAIDPSVDVGEIALAVGAADLDHLLEGVSLVVAATDDMADQALLAHHAYAAGVPLVACALYGGAAAGEVVLSVPASGTACWSCAVGAGTAAESYRPPGDYGLEGRLTAEVALGPPIQLVAEVAATAALGLLAGRRHRAHLTMTRLLTERRTLGVIATAPQWQFFPRIFPGMDHQHAPQSVWIRVGRTEACPVCGSAPVPPLNAAAGAQISRLGKEATG